MLLGFAQGADNEIYVLTNNTVISIGTTGTVYLMESGPGRIAFTFDTYTVSLRSSQAGISVARSGGNKAMASVHYATSDGTAAAGKDYRPTSGELVWLNGEDGIKTFQVAVIDDGPAIGDTVNLTLSDAESAPLGDTDTAVLAFNFGDGSNGGGLGFAVLVALLVLVLRRTAWRQRTARRRRSS